MIIRMRLLDRRRKLEDQIERLEKEFLGASK